ncbi:MAG TPA: hypothetical protein VLH13_00655 [Methanomassiliicoccales archaeon]|nr:hypothetical protein [Methanomassiliicoccales archaeon]
MYGGPEVIQIPRNYGKVKFSRIEIKHILISVTVLTLIFALFFYPDVEVRADMGFVGSFLLTLGVAATAVVLGFLLHELGHKFMAQRYGAWAEFRMFPIGLLIGVVFSFLGVLLAMPGAVYIQGQITRRQYGQVSLAGPATNLVIGAVFLIVWLVVPLGTLLAFCIYLLALINIFLGGFNLIPLPPFDGEKIARWSIPVYLITVISAGVMLMVLWGIIKI